MSSTLCYGKPLSVIEIIKMVEIDLIDNDRVNNPEHINYVMMLRGLEPVGNKDATAGLFRKFVRSKSVTAPSETLVYD